MSSTGGSDLLLGHRVGGVYELVQVLGKGGMAVVYRGRHLVTEQDVAVKVLPPELAEHADVRERFIAEARTLARLEHPNIVRLYNFLQEEGRLYIVMQYADGETFDHIIAREGRVPAADVVAVGVQTLEALCYAHERDVVHRDIKPSNIVIRGDGAIKVMDFGIAKIVGSTKLTQTGQTMGTVRYMSPEQVRGKAIDRQTDIYSLGITLYEACTGRTPFDGDTHFDIMHKHLREMPRAPGEFVEIPPELDDALMRALRKLPHERFADADEFRRALRAVPVDERGRRITASVPAAATGATRPPAADRRPPARHWSRIGPGLVAALMLLSAIGAVIWVLLSDDGARSSAHPVRPGRAQQSSRARSASWPEPHGVAKSMTWRVDKRFEADRLRILSVVDRDPEELLLAYRRMSERYRQYLHGEGMDLVVGRWPLNLAIVPRSVFRAQKGWVSPRYEAPSRTLYIDGDKTNLASTDLPYGLALHFCVPIAQLSNERCVELAEDFERFLAQNRVR